MTKTINGIQLYYEYSRGDGGSDGELDGDGLPIVFLNGIAMSTSHWKAYQEAFAGRPVVLHDFKDQLRSAKADGPYQLESHADELMGLLNELGIERAHIVGTSYGSEVAMLFALNYPTSTVSLTVIDGVSESDALLKATVESWKTGALTDPRCFYRTLIPWTYSSRYIQENREALTAREAAIAGLPSDFFDGFARLCDAFLDYNITDRLSQISCPALVVVGDQDILKTPRYAKIIQDRIPGARLEIVPEAGHAVVVERPQAVIDIIGGFLSQIG